MVHSERGLAVEFGIFLNGYIPGPAAHHSASEHTALMREADYTIHADKHNWKYAWFGEHHGLTEYSHMSAPEVMFGYIAAQTDRIHLCSGINNLSPRVNHPVRNAERAAMLDHVTGNRYEWGTGRGAGSHELATFNVMDKNSTKAEWEEVIHEIPRMWEQVDYTFAGDHFTVPTPHNILPKPHGKGHPAMWVACGNPPTFARAGQLGIGAIAFNFEPIYNLQGRIDSYKEAVATCTEPLGQYLNNNVMMTNAVVCLGDRKRARELALDSLSTYLVTMVNMYHDTMPQSPDAIVWPNAPFKLREIAGSDPEAFLDSLIKGGYLLCGTPDEVCEQVVAYQSVGCDQLVFGLPGSMEHEEVFEMLEAFGQKVIPEFDKDPMHSTTRARQTAKPKYAKINGPLPEFTVPERIPTNAILPLPYPA
jgi:alkanesulfonate monooxygenase SsuD/methylene tetrahydromethanopterin reductase-like flavin-dependent oxidoreductase (luciferase family)